MPDHPPGPTFRGRSAARWLWASIWSLVLGLLGFETLTRLIGVQLPGIAAPGDRGDRGLWVMDANLGWFHAPRTRGLCFLGGPDAAEVRLNALGLRGAELEPEPQPGVRRVLVLGDSFAFGVGVDEQHTFSAVLGQRLGARYEVVNLGVSGYSTDQEYLLFESLGVSLRPSVVVLLMCDNDFHGNSQDFAYRAYYKPYFELADGLVRRNQPVPHLNREQRARLWLARHSNTWKTLRAAVGGRFPKLFEVSRSRPSRPDVELTFALVGALRRSVLAAGGSLVVLNTGHRGEDTTLFHQLRRLLRRDGFTFLGLEETLGRARAARPGGRWDFGQDSHWNVDSHRLAAEVAEGLLRDRRLVD